MNKIFTFYILLNCFKFIDCLNFQEIMEYEEDFKNIVYFNKIALLYNKFGIYYFNNEGKSELFDFYKELTEIENLTNDYTLDFLFSNSNYLYLNFNNLKINHFLHIILELDNINLEIVNLFKFEIDNKINIIYFKLSPINLINKSLNLNNIIYLEFYEWNKITKEINKYQLIKNNKITRFEKNNSNKLNDDTIDIKFLKNNFEKSNYILILRKKEKNFEINLINDKNNEILYSKKFINCEIINFEFSATSLKKKKQFYIITKNCYNINKFELHFFNYKINNNQIKIEDDIKVLDIEKNIHNIEVINSYRNDYLIIQNVQNLKKKIYKIIQK